MQRTVRQQVSKGLDAPCQDDVQAPNVGTFVPSLTRPTQSVNKALQASFVEPGVQVQPVTGSRALEHARVHDVLVDGERVGGICWARGAWRILSNAQARFASREDAVNELIRRREGSS
ncbi:MAG: hypothetical protein ABEL51_03760 [Salinibacter sp.]